MHIHITETHTQTQQETGQRIGDGRGGDASGGGAVSGRGGNQMSAMAAMAQQAVQQFARKVSKMGMGIICVEG